MPGVRGAQHFEVQQVRYRDIHRVVRLAGQDRVAERVGQAGAEGLAGNVFLDQPDATPFMPSWNRVQSALPDLLEEIQTAVRLDSEDD